MRGLIYLGLVLAIVAGSLWVVYFIFSMIWRGVKRGIQHVRGSAWDQAVQKARRDLYLVRQKAGIPYHEIGSRLKYDAEVLLICAAQIEKWHALVREQNAIDFRGAYDEKLNDKIKWVTQYVRYLVNSQKSEVAKHFLDKEQLDLVGRLTFYYLSKRNAELYAKQKPEWLKWLAVREQRWRSGRFEAFDHVLPRPSDVAVPTQQQAIVQA